MLATFAADYAYLFPASGNREVLRAVVEETADAWNLECFDVAWHQFRPKCEMAGCEHAVGYQMSLCGEHALAELL